MTGQQFPIGFRGCKECHGEGIVKQRPRMDLADVAPMSLDVEGAQTKSVTVEIVACPACVKRRAEMDQSARRRPAWANIAGIPDLGHWLSANIVEGVTFCVPYTEWRRLTRGYGSPIAAMLDANPLDRLNENLIGSSWGAWEVRPDVVDGGLLITRHPTGDKRTSVSRDRAHLFVRVGDELIHRDVMRAVWAVGDFASDFLGKETP